MARTRLICSRQSNSIKLQSPTEPARTGYDLVIDLAGDTRLSSFRCRRFRPLYDGMVGAKDLIGILLDGHAPRLSLDDSALPEPRRFGLCAIEQPDIVIRGLNNVFSRIEGLLLKAVHEITEDIEATPPDAPSGARADRKTRTAPMKAGRFLLASLGAKVGNRLMRKGSEDDIRWGVGWRFTGGHPVAETNDLVLDHYTRLRDDGQRYYADPFVIYHQDLYHVFVEEFPFDTQKGIICHFTIDKKGKHTHPKPVLSRPYHLSYPFVFEHEGEFWMIPETSGNRAIELYRAEQFPDKWVLEKTLVDRYQG